jgi:hypothetical protein
MLQFTLSRVQGNESCARNISRIFQISVITYILSGNVHITVLLSRQMYMKLGKLFKFFNLVRHMIRDNCYADDLKSYRK